MLYNGVLINMIKAETILRGLAAVTSSVVVGSAVAPEGTTEVLEGVVHTVVDRTHDMTDWLVDLPSKLSGAENGSEGGMRSPSAPTLNTIYVRPGLSQTA